MTFICFCFSCYSVWVSSVWKAIGKLDEAPVDPVFPLGHCQSWPWIGTGQGWKMTHTIDGIHLPTTPRSASHYIRRRWCQFWNILHYRLYQNRPAILASNNASDNTTNRTSIVYEVLLTQMRSEQYDIRSDGEHWTLLYL